MPLTPITDEEFLAVMVKEDRLKSVMLTIKEIDKDHNGYVTASELDDIVKLYYRNELASRDILPILNRFGSLQNRILIDYKNFKNWVRQAQLKSEMEKEGIKSQSDKRSTSPAEIKKSNNALKEKIVELQNKVNGIKKTEKNLEKKLSDYEDYQKSKYSQMASQLRSRQRAKSCLGSRSNLAQSNAPSEINVDELR